MNLTDTHCHLDLEQFDSDRAEVLARARAVGVSHILIPALDLPSSRAVVELAAFDPLLFAAVGVHPNEALTWDSESKGALKALAHGYTDGTDDTDEHGKENPRKSAQSAKPVLSGAEGSAYRKTVAIGEIGLDYYWDSAPHDLQRSILREQLELAGDLSLPVVIHLREQDDAQGGPCAEDLLGILGAWMTELRRGGSPLAERPGVLHSFSGELSTAEEALELGFHIGVTGPITYKNAEAKREILKWLPLERLLIETDAPYLAPVPQRGKRNEPSFVRHIADKIAEIHHTTPDRVAEVTGENARRLFGWG